MKYFNLILTLTFFLGTSQITFADTIVGLDKLDAFAGSYRLQNCSGSMSKFQWYSVDADKNLHENSIESTGQVVQAHVNKSFYDFDITVPDELKPIPFYGVMVNHVNGGDIKEYHVGDGTYHDIRNTSLVRDDSGNIVLKEVFNGEDFSTITFSDSNPLSISIVLTNKPIPLLPFYKTYGRCKLIAVESN
jgi:hypothetical protein